MHLARAVLTGSSAEHSAGALHIEGFLLDMTKVFEDFVCVALREALPPYGGYGSLQAQGVHLDEASAIRMLPDFVRYGDRGAPLAVAGADITWAGIEPLAPGQYVPETEGRSTNAFRAGATYHLDPKII
ncbi:hypothetical protein [Streptomyces sp. NPDC060035]|uniref:5-methylcytosine restriction system specificity protein McrC n=1 Tax=Streptomyces sp. NPDC060035 TaxID=3347044 RepID=UPI00367FC510